MPINELSATEPRLVAFCATQQAELRTVRGAVEAGLPAHTAGLTVVPRHGPESITAAGWTVFEISAEGGVQAQLGDALEALTEALHQALGTQVLCIFSEPLRARSRACLRSKSAKPRVADGDGFQVLRQAAEWLEVEPVPLLRFFAPPEPMPVEGTAQAGGVQVAGEKDVEAEPDEDDRFVEAKLKAARELMEQYRRTKG